MSDDKVIRFRPRKSDVEREVRRLAVRYPAIPKLPPAFAVGSSARTTKRTLRTGRSSPLAVQPESNPSSSSICAATSGRSGQASSGYSANVETRRR